VLSATPLSLLPVAGPYIMGLAPRSAEVLTPAEGRRRFGFEKPADAHHAWRAKHRERVFGLGESPSDEGLIESQALLGSLA
jgi:hypothetical protein